MNNSKWGHALAVAAFALMGTTVGCSPWPLKSDQQAKDSVLALKKLEAKIDTGIAYRDYSLALGEANFSVRQFLESDNAKSAPEFVNSLRNAVKWYKAAEEIWRRSLEAHIMLGYCVSDGLAAFRAKELCDAYPELVTTVPGKRPSMGESLGFSTASLNFNILLQGYAHTNGKAIDGSSGLIYDLATQESWRRAAFEVDNGKRCLSGERPTRPDEHSLKTDNRIELNYLINEAKKGVE